MNLRSYPYYIFFFLDNIDFYNVYKINTQFSMKFHNKHKKKKKNTMSIK